MAITLSYYSVFNKSCKDNKLKKKIDKIKSKILYYLDVTLNFLCYGKLRKGKLKKRDVILTTRGTIGNTGIFDDQVSFEIIRINSGMLKFRPDETIFLSEYLFYFFQSENAKDQIKNILSESAQPQLPIRNLKHIKIPIPNIKIQKEIVQTIGKELSLVEGNKQLVECFQQKIKNRIAKVWGK